MQKSHVKAVTHATTINYQKEERPVNDEHEQHGAVDKNNRFVNLPSLPWLSEISGAVHLALSRYLGAST